MLSNSMPQNPSREARISPAAQEINSHNKIKGISVKNTSNAYILGEVMNKNYCNTRMLASAEVLEQLAAFTFSGLFLHLVTSQSLEW